MVATINGFNCKPACMPVIVCSFEPLACVHVYIDKIVDRGLGRHVCQTINTVYDIAHVHPDTSASIALLVWTPIASM